MSRSWAYLVWGGVMGTTVPIAMSKKLKCWFNKLLNFSNICKSFLFSLGFGNSYKFKCCPSRNCNKEILISCGR